MTARKPRRSGPPLVDEHGVTIHRPIELEPRRLRPDGDDEDRGYYGPRDPVLEQNWSAYPPETADEWRARNRAAEVETLLEPLRGLPLTEYETRWLTYLTHGERSTVVVTASVFDRLYRAGVEAGRAEGITAERERAKTRRAAAKRRPSTSTNTD